MNSIVDRTLIHVREILSDQVSYQAPISADRLQEHRISDIQLFVMSIPQRKGDVVMNGTGSGTPDSHEQILSELNVDPLTKLRNSCFMRRRHERFLRTGEL